MAQLTAWQKFIQVALKYGLTHFGLPKTGQIIKYRIGDDGDYEVGNPKEGPRFTDNGDNTITDNATALMWVKDPKEIGEAWRDNGNPSGMEWDQAIDICYGISYAGHNDWRLPNIKELQSLVDYGNFNPAIFQYYFPEITSGEYWSSTSSVGEELYAWTQEFYAGETYVLLKAWEAATLPVRGGL